MKPMPKKAAVKKGKQVKGKARKKKGLKPIKQQPKAVRLSEPPSRKPLQGEKPDIRRIVSYDNGYEIYLQNGRKVAMIVNDDGTITFLTKRVLGKEDSITTFNPARVFIEAKGGVKLGVLRVRLSKQIVGAMLIAFTKMLKAGMLKQRKVAEAESESNEQPKTA